jgi:hypothetical protein
VGFIHDDELGALQNKVFSPASRFNKVGGDDGEAVSIKDGDAYRQITLQALDGAA